MFLLKMSAGNDMDWAILTLWGLAIVLFDSRIENKLERLRFVALNTVTVFEITPYANQHQHLIELLTILVIGCRYKFYLRTIHFI